MTDRLRPAVGVGALIRCGSELLLMKRAPKLGRGSWSTPGGHLEFGETVKSCAKRETKEELGLTLDSFDFLAVTDDLFEDRHFITIWMVAMGNRTDIVTASGEVLEYGWFEVGKLPEPLFEPFRKLLAGLSMPKDAWHLYLGRS